MQRCVKFVEKEMTEKLDKDKLDQKLESIVVLQVNTEVQHIVFVI